ncbi:helix-turn-helix domain-containing protein [Chryseobacterium arthrosphaerae]|uniref:helix-turn-helix domain-containing protein n=1 Tax=Chryseobacterium arthrosphaerae TaxID=651561 RepID=UPI001E30D3A9|nr:AraC family transcriptional regulator [Chryseobacterium arthrosphaerae]UEQ78368.1 helix-turn-helix transcriptional regulator [Chryseobacterium arthrosphaerae]
MKHKITTYDLSDVSQHNFLVERIEKRTEQHEEFLIDKGVHRDSHYIFTCMESGNVRMMVDFKIIESRGATIFCVLPGQVHQGLLMENVSGWFVAVKTDSVPDVVRAVFEEYLVEILPLPLDQNWTGKIHAAASLLKNYFTDDALASREGFLVIQSLLNAYMGMFSHLYLRKNSLEILAEKRSSQLTRAFRILVRKEFKTMKSPSEYAESLHISRGYLTEVIREVTGNSAQHYIHQEVLIEAKRLLAFTHLTVKEIAYELGYNDHTYFSRLFSKLEGQSPSQFRASNKNQG